MIEPYVDGKVVSTGEIQPWMFEGRVLKAPEPESEPTIAEAKKKTSKRKK